MPGDRIVKEVFENIAEGKLAVGKLRKRWLGDAENSR